MEFAPLTGDRLPKWIVHHADKALGREITPEAVALLAEAVGSDLAQLAVELEKLASYTTGDIDERAVSDVVGVRRGESLGDFLDAVAAKDVVTALGLIPIVMQLPKTTGVSIVMALTTQTLALAYGDAALASGVAQRNLFSELMTLLKDTGAYPGRPWGEAVTAWAKYTSRWSGAELDGRSSRCSPPMRRSRKRDSPLQNSFSPRWCSPSAAAPRSARPERRPFPPSDQCAVSPDVSPSCSSPCSARPRRAPHRVARRVPHSVRHRAEHQPHRRFRCPRPTRSFDARAGW